MYAFNNDNNSVCFLTAERLITLLRITARTRAYSLISSGLRLAVANNAFKTIKFLSSLVSYRRFISLWKISSYGICFSASNHCPNTDNDSSVISWISFDSLQTINSETTRIKLFIAISTYFITCNFPSFGLFV